MVSYFYDVLGFGQFGLDKRLVSDYGIRVVNRKITVVVTGTLGFDYIMDFRGKFADRIMPDKIHKISLSF